VAVVITKRTTDYTATVPPALTDAVAAFRNARQRYGKQLMRWDGEYAVWRIGDVRVLQYLATQAVPLHCVGFHPRELESTLPLPILHDEGLKRRAKTEHFFGLRVSPYPFQSLILSRLREWNYSALLASGTGTGKTLCAIAAVQQQSGYALAIVQDSTHTKWQRDAWRFAGLVPNVIPFKNDKPARAAALANIPNCKLTLLTFAQVRMYADELAALTATYPCDLLVVDEAHGLAHDSKQTAAVLGDRTHPGLTFSRFLPMTATPLINHPLDLWNILHRLDPVEWGDVEAFSARYCTFINTPRGRRPKGVREEHLPELYERTARTTIRVTTESVFPDLPPYQPVDVEVTLGAKEYENYRRAATDLGAWLREQGKSAREVAATLSAKALTQTHYLRRASAMGKVRAAMEIGERVLRSGEQIVVFSQYLEPLAMMERELRARLPEIGIAQVSGNVASKEEMQAGLDEFQSGKRRVALCSHTKGGVGIELFAARIAVLLDEPWTAKEVEQDIGRIYRNGQTRQSIIYTLLAEGTIDGRVHAVIAAKRAMMERVMDGRETAEMSEETVLGAVLDEIERMAERKAA
jgi:SNF2 family DNA or RNA helicase